MSTIRDWQGKIVGFRCHQCGEIRDRMWGNTCNSCCATNEANAEMIALKKREVEALEKLAGLSHDKR